MPSLTKVQTGFVEAQGALPLSSGTAAAPGLKFSDHDGTGMFSPSTGAIGFSTSGHQQALTISTSGNVGIGQNNPDWHLDVQSTSVNAVIRLKSTGSTNGGQLQVNSDDLILRNRDAGDIQLWTSDTPRVTIESGGNVGINDTTPDATLSVAGSTAFIDVGAEGGNRGKIGYSSNDLYFGTSSSSGEFIFKNNVTSTDNPASSGSEKLRIDSNGRIGHGNPYHPEWGAGLVSHVPQSSTTVYFRPSGQYTASLGRVDNTDTTQFIAIDSNYAKSSAVSAGIFLSSYHADAGGSACGHTIKNLKSDAGGLTFNSVKTAASVNNPAVETELLRIKTNGNVGINQTSPSEKLEVYAGDILLSGNANGVSGGVGPDSAIKFEYNGHQYAKIVGNGRDSSGYGDIDFYTSTSAGVTNLTQRMTIRADGKIGIGTETPTRMLHVASTGTDSLILVTGTTPQIRLNSNAADSNDNDRAIFGLATASGQFFSTAVSGDTCLRTTDEGNLLFGEGTTERFRMTSSGNFGIATNSPNKKLTIQGTDNNFIELRHATRSGIHYIEHSGTNSETLAFFQNNGTNTNAYARFGRSITEFYRANGASDNSVFYIDSVGNVGINQTAPAQRLHVVGAMFQEGNDNLLFFGKDNGGSNTSSNNTHWIGRIDSAGYHATSGAGGFNGVAGSFGIGAKGPIMFATSSATDQYSSGRMFISTSGNVGIGTDNPTEKLYVNGTTRLGGGTDYGSTTILSIAPGVVKWDTAGVAGGRLNADQNGNWYLNNKSYPVYNSLGVNMNDIYGANSDANNIGGWVYLGSTQHSAPYPRKAYKISAPDGNQGTFVYQVWYNGDANYDWGGLYEIRINNWSENSRLNSVAVTCINGDSDGLRVYAYNDTNGIWITTNAIWGSLYIRKFGYDDSRRSRGSSLCAVDNGGHLAQADVNGTSGTIPSGYTEVHASDSGGGGYDIENNHRFQAGQGGP